MSRVRIKWKTLALLTFLVLEAILAFFYPIFHTKQTVRTSRKLMMSTGEQEFDGHVRYLQKQLHVVRIHSDYQIHQLQERNKELRSQLESQKKLSKIFEKRNLQLIERMEEILAGGHRREQLENRLAPKVTPMDLRLLNTRLSSEYEVLFYSLYNKNFLYSIEGEMNHKPEVIPTGNKKKEKDEVIALALDKLNGNHTTVKKYQLNDFIFGFVRQDRLLGTQYELYFKTASNNMYQHVSIFRPFSPLQMVVMEIFNKQDEWINIIMPLQGRLDKLEVFLTMYSDIVMKDSKLFLTIVYFGEAKKMEAKRLLEDTTKKINYTNFVFIEKSGNFSRGGGLLAGARAWKKGNVLMYFCDVDIHFTVEFLQRCRLNSAPGAKVYYPIVFSMYNPELVYMNEPEIPKLEERFVIHKDSGFWRTFGFGMVCIYRSDFIFNKGFNTKIQGWGWEDVQLYRKLISSNLEVMRSPDPGIYHIWHEKECDASLSPKQYDMCLGSKAKADGSVSQLGMIAYGRFRDKKKNGTIHI